VISSRPTTIIAAAAVSAYGRGWRGLGTAIRERSVALGPVAALQASAPGTIGSEVADRDLVAGPAPRVRKMMTRGAVLAAVGLRDLAADVGRPLGDAGLFLGVGASAVPIADVVPLLAASFHAGPDAAGFSLERFGQAGLNACNPLLAFQLMNNFTLCHAAIQEGVGGPSGAFFSRGGGTVTALFEAQAAIARGDCTIAVAGAADSALHPVTWAELIRDGFAAGGLTPAEGCGLLALSDQGPGIASLDACMQVGASADAPALARLAHDILGGWPGQGGASPAIVIAPWGEPARGALRLAIDRALPRAPVLDLSLAIGDALAASPALAWVAAVDLLAAALASHVAVLSAGIDGALGVAFFSQERR
jgi:3-oxoacyl-[acyl-carrier-protein] synthase II